MLLLSVQVLIILISEKLPSFHGRFIRGIIDEAHAIKDPESNLFKALYLMGFEYRHLLTATPLINSHPDIIGIAGFLHRQEFEDQAHVADNFNIWEEDVAPEDPRALLALSRQRIANRFRSIDWGDLDSTEFANLRVTMRKILLPIQLRRANGTVFKEADGREVIMGNDIPPYVVHTIYLCMEPDGVKEYAVGDSSSRCKRLPANMFTDTMSSQSLFPRSSSSVCNNGRSRRLKRKKVSHTPTISNVFWR